MIGNQAPDFALQDHFGREVTLSQFRGKNKKDIVTARGDLNATFLASADHLLSIQYPVDKDDLGRIYRVDRLDPKTVFTGERANGHTGLTK